MLIILLLHGEADAVCQRECFCAAPPIGCDCEEAEFSFREARTVGANITAD
jgi:hypothetical protein